MRLVHDVRQAHNPKVDNYLLSQGFSTLSPYTGFLD